jgi:hypothetical protein
VGSGVEGKRDKMTLVEEFIVTFDVWEVARPYIHMIVDEREMELIVRMQGRSMTADKVAELMETSVEKAADLLQRCYSRCIVDRLVEGGVTRYAAADFAARLNHFAKYENWDDIPAHARKAIDRRFLDEFIM